MKNRKLISFLSLFSLVLILGVYYVLLPPVEIPNNPIDENVNVGDGEEAYFVSLNLEKEEERLRLVHEQYDIIASPMSSVEEKSVALEYIQYLDNLKVNEEDIKTLLKEAGFPNVYVEYEDKVINLLVTKRGNELSDAADIVSSIWKKYGRDYLPQIRFK